MSSCCSLTKLPDLFGELRSLQFLNLSKCDKLEELCSDFHCLGALKELNLSGCCSLTRLPDFFGKLKSLQTLNLSKCDKLEELCGDFHCLGALKELSLSGCCSLTRFPDCFGQLVCLENVDLSGCSNLANISDDFHTLPSLTRLNLSNCKRLGAEWMDRVEGSQSLLYIDISGNEGITQRWMEMRREKEERNLAVKMVLKLPIEDEKRKRKALKVVAVVEGVDSVAVDMKEKTMTVIGEADPLFIASRLREFGFNFVELQSVGPAKERNKEKKEENKSENPTTVYVPRVYYDYSLENDEQCSSRENFGESTPRLEKSCHMSRLSSPRWN
ncbi:disease resistance protein TAO1 isoform X2 [Cryptomeria japonica]|uniref:disease resistance protein TAO1 isoform X2 n=1 Tax=Cryptomeria japonica TaxID=3369 RepID=UPI0027D9FED5|nr:disease resistance protein TAO1 isoform X2 [Cryptomeria japonica]